MKLIAKFAVRLMIEIICYLPLNVQIRFELITKFVPYVLDGRILKDEHQDVRLNGYKNNVAANPFTYIHLKPFFLGVLHEMHLQKYIEKNVKLGDTVVDVGCNVGQVAVIACENVGPSGKVYAFEPNPVLCEIISKQISSNNDLQIELFQFALGEEDAMETLTVDQANSGLGSLRNHSIHTTNNDLIEVEVKNGDEVFKELELSGKVFMKCDVEGFELEVLRGIPKALTSLIDHAIIEVSPNWIGEDGVEEVFRLMNNAGFESYLLTVKGDIAHACTAIDITKQSDVLFKKTALF